MKLEKMTINQLKIHIGCMVYFWAGKDTGEVGFEFTEKMFKEIPNGYITCNYKSFDGDIEHTANEEVKIEELATTEKGAKEIHLQEQLSSFINMRIRAEENVEKLCEDVSYIEKELKDLTNTPN